MSTKIAPLSGFPEWLPAERVVEQAFLDVIRETFELHGFVSVETRAVEPVSRLLGKGGDADKEIYGVHRLAADADDKDADDPDKALGLHFDLTVPFARYVLENAGKLTFPFRRYQIQKVWRGERPQEGRFREFTQCDIDIVDVGELAAHYEAEMPLVIADVFSRLPIGDYRIQVNNRKIPEGFYLGLGLTDVVGTLRIVDKLDKIGPEGVTELLAAAGATDEQISQCLRLAEISSQDTSFADRVRALGVCHPPSTRASPSSPPSWRPRSPSGPASSSPTCGSPAAWTTTRARSTRPSWSGTSPTARSAPAGGTTRWPPTGGPPIPAWASPSACPGCSRS